MPQLKVGKQGMSKKGLHLVQRSSLDVGATICSILKTTGRCYTKCPLFLVQAAPQLLAPRPGSWRELSPNSEDSHVSPSPSEFRFGSANALQVSNAMDPHTTTREQFSASLVFHPIPANATQEWKEIAQVLQKLHERLAHHEVMAPNLQQTYMTPANSKNTVYFMWDFVGRTLVSSPAPWILRTSAYNV